MRPARVGGARAAGEPVSNVRVMRADADNEPSVRLIAVPKEGVARPESAVGAEALGQAGGAARTEPAVRAGGAVPAEGAGQAESGVGAERPTRAGGAVPGEGASQAETVKPEAAVYAEPAAGGAGTANGPDSGATRKTASLDESGDYAGTVNLASVGAAGGVSAQEAPHRAAPGASPGGTAVEVEEVAGASSHGLPAGIASDAETGGGSALDPSAAEAGGGSAPDRSAAEAGGGSAPDRSAAEAGGGVAPGSSAAETEGGSAPDSSAVDVEGTHR